jgi:hypothetical protein
MNNDLQIPALAARDAHEALLDLQRFVEEAARTTHCVELEAVHLAVSSSKDRRYFLKIALCPRTAGFLRFRGSFG